MPTKAERYAEFYGGGDPNVEGKGGNFSTWEDGEYKIKGIARFFSVDSEDPPNPVFIPNFDGNMVARLNLLLAEPKDGSSEGPPWSGTRAEICALVAASGADISKLPAGEGTGFLLAAQKTMNDAGVVLIAKVKGGKGWARYVEGAAPPDEAFLWNFIGARGYTKRDEITFQTKTEEWNGKKIEKDVLMLRFEIAGKPNGKPSNFNGYVVEVELRDPFEGYRYKADGKPLPNMKPAANGGLLPSVKDFFNFMDIFWPSHWDWEWQEDPEKSSVYGINELDNPILVYIGESVKAKQGAIAKLSLTKGGRPYLKLGDFSRSGLDDDDLQTEPVRTDPTELMTFVLAAEKASGMGKKLFDATSPTSDVINTNFSTEGKLWAGRVLGKLCDALRYPRSLRDLSPAQLSDLTAHIEAVGDKEDKEIEQYVLNLQHKDTF